MVEREETGPEAAKATEDAMQLNIMQAPTVAMGARGVMGVMGARAVMAVTSPSAFMKTTRIC
jgi:hypothetical protein